MSMYNLTEGRIQLVRYNQKLNSIPKVRMNFRIPIEVLNDCLAVKSRPQNFIFSLPTTPSKNMLYMGLALFF